MNILYKQIIYIISISLILSIVRYFFIEDEYPIIKPISKASVETYSADASIDSLRNYLNDIKEPKIVDLELAKKIHENTLATFIDARDEESFNESHIKGAVNITYEWLDDFAEAIDIEWILEINENYLVDFNMHGEPETCFFGQYEGTTFINGYIPNVDYGIKKYMEIYGPIKNNQTIFVIYCSGEGCSLSEELAFYMYDRFKIKKVLIYEGGMPEWIENGLPVE